MPTTHLLARAVIRDEGRVLVVRAEGQSHTFLPGGHREPGEGLEACLHRELAEELGVEITVGRYLGTVEHTWQRRGERQYELNHCFAASGASLALGATPSAREGHLTFGWVPVERLDEAALEPAPLRRLLADGVRDEPWWASTLGRDAPSRGDAQPRVQS